MFGEVTLVVKLKGQLIDRSVSESIMRQLVSPYVALSVSAYICLYVSLCC